MVIDLVVVIDHVQHGHVPACLLAGCIMCCAPELLPSGVNAKQATIDCWREPIREHGLLSDWDSRSLNAATVLTDERCEQDAVERVQLRSRPEGQIASRDKKSAALAPRVVRHVEVDQ